VTGTIWKREGELEIAAENAPVASVFVAAHVKTLPKPQTITATLGTPTAELPSVTIPLAMKVHTRADS